MTQRLSPFVNLSPFPANSSFRAATNFSRIFSRCENTTDVGSEPRPCKRARVENTAPLHAGHQRTHLVDLRELDALLWRAAPADGGHVEHSIPELDEGPPEGGGTVREVSPRNVTFCYAPGDLLHFVGVSPFLRQLDEAHVPEAEVDQVLQQLLAQLVLNGLVGVCVSINETAPFV